MLMGGALTADRDLRTLRGFPCHLAVSTQIFRPGDRHGPLDHSEIICNSAGLTPRPSRRSRRLAKGARLYTDEFRPYRRARRWGFRHRRIKHLKRFARGQTHTQGIEGYWGHLKPTLVARHRAVHPHYLPGDLAEADYKHNLPQGADFIRETLGQLLEPMAYLPLK